MFRSHWHEASSAGGVNDPVDAALVRTLPIASRTMRLGVLDVGSNTVHLLVVDAHAGAPPTPAYSSQGGAAAGRAARRPTAASSGEGTKRLTAFMHEALAEAEDKGVEEVLAFATSAIREAPNGEEVLARVERETGVPLEVLTGEDEARLTFLAVRRWYGWSAGRLLVLDIGGGSLEVAIGQDEEPDTALSLPLGAGRLTRDWLPGDPPVAEDVRAAAQARPQRLRPRPRPGHPLAVSPTGSSGPPRRSARSPGSTGAAPSGEGPYVRRRLRHSDLTARLPRARQDDRCRARRACPASRPGRAHQLLAGALVADAAMDLLGVSDLDICPWALREGVILRYLDYLGAARDE